MNNSLPVIPPIAEEIISEVNIPEPNVTIEEIPVASNVPIIIPEATIIDPIPVVTQIELTVDNIPNNTVRMGSRIPVLSPIINPTVTRLRTSNVKPKGFYKT
ncbi:unnamed protein product [Rotaria socialis]|uniref:Uncharacterized protein n=1 Tax=Rotaria socialis TaxID=392032 RepID=A0A818B5Z8_9BILA|nr:unnamed protein product [Rotaria socialis]CAF4912982.1 unnamed protein product [Rotaria socialis]